MNTQRKHSTHERGIRITLVTLITVAGLVACGSDDNNATENGTGPAAPVTTEPASDDGTRQRHDGARHDGIA